MAIWPFNRKNRNETNVPEEIQEYYQAERRERVGVAWLLALATLVVTVLLAIGLFFGGRWAYRAIFDSDDTQTAQNDQQEADDQNQNEQNNDDGNDDEQPAPQDNEDERPADDEDTPEEEPAEEPEEEDRLPGDETEDEEDAAAADDEEPAANDEPLPDTGPGDVVAVFAVTSAAGAVGHHLVTTRRRKD